MISSQVGAQEIPVIRVAEFEKGIAGANIQVLDVRTLAEYNSGHIRGALLADWTQRANFELRARSLDKDKPVYTYCLSGGRSSAAAAWLKQAGFKEVYNLSGGILAWKNEGRPVEGVVATTQWTLADYKAMIPANETVLVDFGAVWCPPCKKMEPVLKELVNSGSLQFKLVKVDGGTQESLAKAVGADAFPTFIVYKNGKETWRGQGVFSKEELAARLK